DPSVRGGDRAGAGRDAGESLFVDFLAGGHLPAAEDVVAAGAVQVIADDDARAARRHGDLDRPLDVRHADVALPRRLDGGARLSSAAVVHVDQSGAEHRGGLYGRGAARPEHFARVRVESLNAAGHADELEAVAYAENCRRGHAVVVAALLFPLQLAGLLVE